MYVWVVVCVEHRRRTRLPDCHNRPPSAARPPAPPLPNCPQAVDGIHRERIVHSDLKPANFLVVEGQLKLIDFGIAKAIQSGEGVRGAA